MKFDVILIGGGHSGLERGIALQRAGRRCLIVCAGESPRRFLEPAWSQDAQRRKFELAGGIYLMGDRVLGGDFAGNVLQSVRTEKHGTGCFEAGEFWLATGSFFSGGLVATHDAVYEPVFGLDVDYSGGHSDWVDEDFFAEQPFMRFGVKVDGYGRVLRGGIPVENLFAVGSVVSRRQGMAPDRDSPETVSEN